MTHAPKPDVTIAVVPRERFGLALRSLDDLYANTRVPFRLVYVDGRSPRRVRRALEHRARELGFLLVRSERYLTPNEARNIALRHVETEYVVFLDNDVLVSPGWLESLVSCAQETKASICGPLQLIGPLQEQRIHIAGGTAHIATDELGRRSLVDRHRFAGSAVPEVRRALRREPSEIIEFHCMLARTDLFVDVGHLDEALLNVNEHTDLCLLAAERGREIYFEPASVVSWIPPSRLSWSELRYYMLRWSESWTLRSLDHFVRKWRLDAKDSGLEPTLNHSRWRRRQAWLGLLGLREHPSGPLESWLRSHLFRPAARIAGLALVRWTKIIQGWGRS